MVAIGLTAPFLITKRVLPKMKKKGMELAPGMVNNYDTMLSDVVTPYSKRATPYTIGS